MIEIERKFLVKSSDYKKEAHQKTKIVQLLKKQGMKLLTKEYCLKLMSLRDPITAWF